MLNAAAYFMSQQYSEQHSWNIEFFLYEKRERNILKFLLWSKSTREIEEIIMSLKLLFDRV